jgi:polyhydroxyalkanoate synthesis repressor PhaR
MPSIRRGGKDNAAVPQEGSRIIKKYPNRRLYDTRTSAYITLSEVKDMVLGLESFEVRDAKTGDDLTRSILLQIILEEETAGVPMFSTQMLAQIIRFYGHTMQGLMGSYLERNLQTFVEVQRRVAEQAPRLDSKNFTPDAWAQIMGLPASPVPSLMGNYLEQSRQLFTQMQEQMQKQAASLFPASPSNKDSEQN